MKTSSILFVLFLLFVTSFTSLSSFAQQKEKSKGSMEINGHCFWVENVGGHEEISINARGMILIVDRKLREYTFTSDDRNITISKTAKGLISYQRKDESKTETLVEGQILNESEKIILQKAKEKFLAMEVKVPSLIEEYVNETLKNMSLAKEFFEEDGYLVYMRGYQTVHIKRNGYTPTWRMINHAREKQEFDKRLKELQ